MFAGRNSACQWFITRRNQTYIPETLKLYHRRRLLLYKGISHTSSGGDAIDSASDVREVVGEHVLVEVRPMMSQVDVYACLRKRVVTPLTNVCS